MVTDSQKQQSNGRERTDDKFMRSLFWAMFGTLIASIGGWIWTIAVIQAQVTQNAEKLKHYDAFYENVIEMRQLLKTIVEQNREFKNTLDNVRTEQQLRTQTINQVRDHMRDKSAHNR